MPPTFRKRTIGPALAITLSGPCLFGCGSSDVLVRYEVAGTGSAHLSYTTAPNSRATIEKDRNLPFVQEFRIPKSDRNSYVLTVVQIPGGGPVSCKITVDGTVIDEKHDFGNGFGNIADCARFPQPQHH